MTPASRGGPPQHTPPSRKNRITSDCLLELAVSCSVLQHGFTKQADPHIQTKGKAKNDGTTTKKES